MESAQTGVLPVYTEAGLKDIHSSLCLPSTLQTYTGRTGAGESPKSHGFWFSTRKVCPWRGRFTQMVPAVPCRPSPASRSAQVSDPRFINQSCLQCAVDEVGRISCQNYLSEVALSMHSTASEKNYHKTLVKKNSPMNVLPAPNGHWHSHCGCPPVQAHSPNHGSDRAQGPAPAGQGH